KHSPGGLITKSTVPSPRPVQRPRAPASSSVICHPSSVIVSYNQALLGKVFGVLEGYTPLLLRLALAVIFIHAGLGKIFGIWGGYGLEKTAIYFGPPPEGKLDLPLPILMASLAGIGEVGGGFLVRIGPLTPS